MSIFTRDAVDLTHTALGDVVDIRTLRERISVTRSGIEADERAHRDAQFARGDEKDLSERRRLGRQAAEFQETIDERKHELDVIQDELTALEQDTRTAIEEARRPGLHALARENLARALAFAAVNQRLLDYEIETARLTERPSAVAEFAWPELVSEPGRDSLLDLHAPPYRAAGLLG